MRLLHPEDLVSFLLVSRKFVQTQLARYVMLTTYNEANIPKINLIKTRLIPRCDLAMFARQKNEKRLY